MRRGGGRSRMLQLGRESHATRLAILPVPYPEGVEKPRSRSECREAARPCPFVSCRMHLYLDVQVRTGNILLNFPDHEVDELKESCALDIAERGGATLEEIGAALNVSRERARQIEESSLSHLPEEFWLKELPT